MVDISLIESELAEQGFSYCKGLPYEEFEKVSAHLGKEIMNICVEVRHFDDDKPLVTSSEPITLHTDHYAARYVAWYCLRHDPDGGETILSDSRQFLDKFSQREISDLKGIKLFVHDIFDEGERQYCPILRDGEDNNLFVYFSSWLADSTARENQAFKKLIDLSNRFAKNLHLQSGDCLIVDNQRVMHGRTQIMNMDRKLERKWLC